MYIVTYVRIAYRKEHLHDYNNMLYVSTGYDSSGVDLGGVLLAIDPRYRIWGAAPAADVVLFLKINTAYVFADI